MTWPAAQPLLISSALLLVAWALAAGALLRGGRRIRRLLDLPLPGAGELPPASVLVAARNEAGAVEGALRSLLAQDYPALEVVAVDDRSTDGTGRILDRLADAHPRLRVLHVEELPPRWLGKTHALWRAWREAEGEVVLFTDADVHLAPTALRRAVGHLQAEGADHLVAGPEVRAPGRWLEATVGAFQMVFGLTFQPWRVGDPASPHYVGAGAFNLVRAEAYRRVGGHRAVRLRPDEDLRLGQRLKEAGFRQRMVSGRGAVVVEWYATLGDLVRGLEKNAFAAADYRLARAVVGGLALLVLFLGPLGGLVLGRGTTRWLSAAALLSMGVAYADNARRYGTSPWLAPLLPLAGAVVAYASLRSIVLAAATGRIRWRGTSYSLEELRRGPGDR